MAAWFGEKCERSPDVGIWVVRQSAGRWTDPVEVAQGIQHTHPDGSAHRHPTWNPVLFQYPDGPLMLFYKCGPSPSQWWGMAMSSADSGVTWTAPECLADCVEVHLETLPGPAAEQRSN